MSLINDFGLVLIWIQAIYAAIQLQQLFNHHFGSSFKFLTRRKAAYAYDHSQLSTVD